MAQFITKKNQPKIGGYLVEKVVLKETKYEKNCYEIIDNRYINSNEFTEIPEDLKLKPE